MGENGLRITIDILLSGAATGGGILGLPDVDRPRSVQRLVKGPAGKRRLSVQPERCILSREISPAWRAQAPLPILVEPYLCARSTVYVRAESPQDDAEERKQGGEMLNQGLGLLAWDLAQAKTVLAREDAATELIDYNKKSHVGLIRAGSRGLGQFRSLWVGSDYRKQMHYRLLG